MSLLSALKGKHSYLIAIPLLLVLLGAASNQAVLIANHGKFPVMLNERQVMEFQSRDVVAEAKIDVVRAVRASQDATEIADQRVDNKAIQADAAATERAAKATYQDYANVLSARDAGRWEKLQVYAAQTKVDANKAVAAEEKTETDANAVAPLPTNSSIAKSANAKKNFNILNTSVSKDDVAQGQFIDSVHSIMGPNSRLKAMADVFDLGNGIYSIGDFGIILGSYLWPFLTLFFLGLNALKFPSLKQVGYALLGLAVVRGIVEIASFV